MKKVFPSSSLLKDSAERFIKIVDRIFNQNNFFLLILLHAYKCDVLCIQISSCENLRKMFLSTHNHNCFFKIIKIGRLERKGGFMIYRNFIDFLLMFFLCHKSRPQLQPPLIARKEKINYFLIVYI